MVSDSPSSHVLTGVYTGNVTFEWDDHKADANERAHGVTFAEAVTVFDDDLAMVATDPDHSSGEFRLLILGGSNQGRLLLVSYTERGANIRLISARIATRREKKDYENN